MLDDVDQHQPSPEAPIDAETLFSKLKRWVKTDRNSKGQVTWRREAVKITTLSPANSSTRTIRRS
jgi:hypothetical protein